MGKKLSTIRMSAPVDSRETDPDSTQPAVDMVDVLARIRALHARIIARRGLIDADELDQAIYEMRSDRLDHILDGS